MAALSTNKSGTSSFHAKAVASHCRNTTQNMFQLRIQQHPVYLSVVGSVVAQSI